MPRQHRTGKQRRRGFILLETLIAFAILAVMLAAAYRLVGSAGMTLTRAEAAARVLDRMQSELDKLLAGPALTPGSDTAPLDDDFKRVLTVNEVFASRGVGGTARLYRIEIAAYRKDDDRFVTPILRLQTMRVERGRAGS